VAVARKPAPRAVRALVAAALVALLAVVDVGLLAVSVTPLWGSPVGDSAQLSGGSTAAISFVDGQPAALVLAQLPVRDRDPLGYRRDAFGEQGWLELQGCDTRNRMLRRDLTDVVIRPGTEGCVVESGLLRDPYTGATVTFVRGPATSPLTPVDHVVSLADAYRAGAARWPTARRRAFANDPQNLLVTTAAVSAAKGDRTADEWLPPTAMCRYARIVVAVKATHQLSVSAPELDALARVLASCPGERARGAP
jgi:hypothetical protein